MNYFRETQLTFKSFRRMVLGLGIFFGIFNSSSTLADASDAIPFAFGESCEQLFDLIDDELRTLTSPVHADTFARICVPEWPNTCDDYAAVLSQFGELKSSQNDYFCHFNAKK